MNIPTSAIEKAIEGGWSHSDFFALNEDVVIADLENAHIALDPTFWQALGKNKKARNVYEMPRYEWEYQGAVEQYCWEYMAHRFYDLILQGKDTEDFWKELLGITS